MGVPEQEVAAGREAEGGVLTDGAVPVRGPDDLQGAGVRPAEETAAVDLEDADAEVEICAWVGAVEARGEAEAFLRRTVDGLEEEDAHRHAVHVAEVLLRAMAVRLQADGPAGGHFSGCRRGEEAALRVDAAGRRE